MTVCFNSVGFSSPSVSSFLDAYSEKIYYLEETSTDFHKYTGMNFHENLQYRLNQELILTIQAWRHHHNTKLASHYLQIFTTISQYTFPVKLLFVIVIVMYLYSAQYLHILQDSKRYLTNPIVQVQPQLTSN